MPRMTTRQKFRMRRSERAKVKHWGGVKWRPIDIHRMRMREAKPLAFNVIPTDELRDNWIGDPPFGGFDNYVINYGEPLRIATPNVKVSDLPHAEAADTTDNAASCGRCARP